MDWQLGNTNVFQFPAVRALIPTTDYGTGLRDMPSVDVRSDIGLWKPRLTRAALWPLIGGLSFLLGAAIVVGLQSLELDVVCVAGDFATVNLGSFVGGLTYTAALGFAVHRARLMGWRRTAGFAVLAMPWFVVAFNSGVAVYNIAGSKFGVFDPGNTLAFLIWFTGPFAGGIWVTLACLALMLSLRSWRSIFWLFAGSALFAVPAGAMAMVDFEGALDAFTYLFTGWCAVYAAGFSMALPQARREGAKITHLLAEQVRDP